MAEQGRNDVLDRDQPPLSLGKRKGALIAVHLTDVAKTKSSLAAAVRTVSGLESLRDSPMDLVGLQ